MLRDLLMPKLGLTMKDGSLQEWMVSPGQAFRKGDILAVIETEKVAYEIEAEAAGVLVEILHGPGQVVPVGSAIARWRSVGDADEARGDATSSAPRAPEAPKAARPSEAVPVRPATNARTAAGRLRCTPLARRYAAAHGIELGGVRGTGPSGRIRLADVQAAERSAGSGSKGTVEPGICPRTDSGAFVPATPIQAAIARRLAAVKREVPHFYLACEAEVSALLAVRDSLNSGPGYPHLSINHMVVAAVGRALSEVPHANRVWADGQFLALPGTDVGIAVHTPRGLFVPILRDAGRASLDAIARDSARLVDKAREGALEPDDVVGGAIAVSNAGMYNVSYLTPIINPAHSAILGVGSIRQVFRPDANERPALRREVGLVLACDHRVFDGVGGLEFLNRVVAWLENPARLLRNPAPMT